jgi:hypothetical protein
MPSQLRRLLLAGSAAIAIVAAAAGVLVGCAGGGGLTVGITSPSATAHTNGDLAVQVTVSGAPDSVELRVDGELLVALSAPYAYTWATSNHEEGTYALTAIARWGGQTVTSAARTVVVDRTRPTVTARSPSPNASNVWHGDPIRVTFSEPVRASSVSGGSVALDRVGGAPVAAALELDADGTSLTIFMTESLAVPADLRLTLSEAITDLAGNALIAPEPWTWNLPFWQWLGEERHVVDPELTPWYSVLTLTPAGQPLVAWLEERQNTQPPVDIHAALWTGDSWQPQGERLNGEDRSGAMYSWFYTAVDAAGTPFVSWVSSTTARQGWVVRLNGAAWEPVGGGPFTGASDEATGTVAMAIDAAGHPVVAWVAQVGAGFDSTEVRVSRWTGIDWVQLGTPRKRDPQRGSHVPHLVLGADGRPIVAWIERVDDTINSPWAVHVDRWTGATWVPLGGSLGSPPATTNLPRLAVDPADGTLFLGFMLGSTGDLRYAVRRWDPDTATWASLGNLRTTAATNVYGGSLAVDPQGRPVVTWTELRPLDGGGTATFTVVQRREGAQWLQFGGPELAQGAYSVNDIVVDDSGVVYVTALVTEEGPTPRYVRVYRSNGSP